ncbi:MAG: S41 family peptidase [Treponema sp.]|nr:S41 family peptidase [Treponema sp.]
MERIGFLSVKKVVKRAGVFLLCAVAASQCFAASATSGSSSEAQEQRRYLELINNVYQYIQYQYVDDVDAKKVYEGAVRGMLETLDDKYSVYLDHDAWREITDTTQGNFGGVGLSITKPAESTPEKPAYVEVVRPVENSPGYNAGIRAGDKIIAINGEDTAPITMSEVLNRLRGEVGTPVTVTIRRGKSDVFERTLIRAIIENPTVTYAMIGKTGYIKLSGFSSNTASRVQDALDSFKKSGYQSLIIDLRDNGGGLLSSAVDIADKFLDSGTIVSTKSRLRYENSTYRASSIKTTVPKSVPVVVLVNGNTASASEILTGALKDSHRAYVIGTTTYGKGSVQYPIQLAEDDGFKITIARYYSPSDTNIDQVGIEPDREVPFKDFAEDEIETYQKLVDDDTIYAYVDAHPDMTEADIASYAVTLQKTYKLDLRVLRKLVRSQVERTKEARVYDLDYDLQLQEALRIIAEENIPELLKHTKTLKELEQERKAAEPQEA